MSNEDVAEIKKKNSQPVLRNNFPSRRSHIHIRSVRRGKESAAIATGWRRGRLISKPPPGFAGLAWIDDKRNFYRAENRQTDERKNE